MRKSAGVLLYRTNPFRVLLVQSYGGKYGPAKGHFDENETPEECASRELQEETGIQMSSGLISTFPRTRIRNTYIYYIPFPKHFVWNPDSTTVDREITDIRWFIPDGIPVELNSIGKHSLKKLRARQFKRPDNG